MPTRKRLLLYKHSIGDILRAWRLKRKLTQDELGELSGYQKGYLSRVENGVIGQPDDEHLCKLAGALDIPKEYFRDRILPEDVLPSKREESEETGELQEEVSEENRTSSLACPVPMPEEMWLDMSRRQQIQEKMQSEVKASVSSEKDGQLRLILQRLEELQALIKEFLDQNGEGQ